jgi:transcription elongation GreA/GreB family factor
MQTRSTTDVAPWGDFSGFEARCLESLESGTLQLRDLVAPFVRFQKSPEAPRLATLGQMVLEGGDVAGDPAAALEIARIALLADAENADLRRRAIELYRAVYANRPNVDALLEASGLTTGRPARPALRMLDLFLALRPGDALLNRTDDSVAEVIGVDAGRGYVTLKRSGRPATVPLADLVREYERVAADDFRVLRQLRPERLAEMIENDPVALVTGLLHAHGDSLDSDQLEHELTPKYIARSDWSKWWSRARSELKKAPNILMEGRSPVVLRYSTNRRSTEDEAWAAIGATNDAVKALSVFDGYVRSVKRDGKSADAAFVRRVQDHVAGKAAAAEKQRPSEALGWALALAEIEKKPTGAEPRGAALAARLLTSQHDPTDLIIGLGDATLWELTIPALREARPSDWAARLVELAPDLPASLLDDVARAAVENGLTDAMQAHIDMALADPPEFPEVLYWLWKGPRITGLRMPSPDELFGRILQTLSALGRSLNPAPAVMRRFRDRMKAALTLKDHAQARACLERIAPERAITVRQQLARLDGVGDNLPAKLTETLRELHPQLWKVAEVKLAPWEDPNILWSTTAGLTRKTQERDHLVNVTMRDNARRIGEAAALGDLSENAEYKFALEERDLLRARLATMNQELSLARELQPHEVPVDHIGVGSRVVIRHTADGTTRTLTFLGPFDADVDAGVYNYKAPLAQKLMGLRAGERVSFVLDGRETEVEVVSIASGLAS